MCLLVFFIKQQTHLLTYFLSFNVGRHLCDEVIDKNDFMDPPPPIWKTIPDTKPRITHCLSVIIKKQKQIQDSCSCLRESDWALIMNLVVLWQCRHEHLWAVWPRSQVWWGGWFSRQVSCHFGSSVFGFFGGPSVFLKCKILKMIFKVLAFKN